MDRPLLIEYPRFWFRHWLDTLTDASWRIAVLLLFGLLPFLAFWRDELASGERNKALHVLALVANMPTSWLLISFLVVLLLVTVEGSFKKLIAERVQAQEIQESLKSEIARLSENVKSLEAQLQEPKLTIEIIDCDAEEVLGPPSHLPASWGLFGAQTNDKVVLKFK